MGRQTSRGLRWASGRPSHGAVEQSAVGGSKLGGSRFVAELRSSAHPDGESVQLSAMADSAKFADGGLATELRPSFPWNIRTIDDSGADCVIARSEHDLLLIAGA